MFQLVEGSCFWGHESVFQIGIKGLRAPNGAPLSFQVGFSAVTITAHFATLVTSDIFGVKIWVLLPCVNFDLDC